MRVPHIFVRVMSHWKSLVLLIAAAQLASGQAGVSGVVYDSIARAPLAGATVQLLGADLPGRVVLIRTSDAAGRFAFDSVPDGQYSLGFFHPRLDSLGIEPGPQNVVVAGRSVRADLAVPSPARLRATLCGAQSPADSGGALMVGFIRDARDLSPVESATIAGQWFDLFLEAGGLMTRPVGVSATTTANGWFVLCRLPADGTIGVVGTHGTDSTAAIEVSIPADGFLHQDLYIGHARNSLRGTVVEVAGGHPLTGAQVAIVGGPSTRTNERGEWTIADAPEGTRLLDVRAVGYSPERKPVAVIAGAPPVRTELMTMKAVLDTVRVTAARRDNERTGFVSRSRGAAGDFITPEDIARQDPAMVSSLFRMIPRIRLDPGSTRTFLVRGATSTWCTPSVYVDGMYMADLGPDDVDAMLTPQEIAGIEVYTELTVPAQFRRAGSGCGSVLIWTRSDSPRSALTKGRAGIIVAVAALSALLGFLWLRE